MTVQPLLDLIASGDLETLTRREAAVRAVAAVLSSINGLSVLRPPEGAQDAASSPFCVVTAETPIEQDPTIGYVRRHWDLVLRCQFFVQRQTTADAANAELDLLVRSAAAAFEADRNLGGVIDDLLVGAMEDAGADAPDGVNEALAAVLPVTVMYTTGRNPEEIYG